MPSYDGLAARSTTAVSEWHQGSGNWPFMTGNDRSYKNRFTTLAWVCVYMSNWSGPTVWISAGDSIAYPSSPMQAVQGNAHRGRSASQTC
ncbi:hypothetical protein [Sinosporangium siamense]